MCNNFGTYILGFIRICYLKSPLKIIESTRVVTLWFPACKTSKLALHTHTRAGLNVELSALRAIAEGLAMAVQFGCTNIVVESDAYSVIGLINSNEAVLHELGSIYSC